MKAAIENFRKQVDSVAKYTSDGKRQELERLIELLQTELARNLVQSQRIMTLLRAIINRHPGSTKAINELLRNPKVSAKISQGNFIMD